LKIIIQNCHTYKTTNQYKMAEQQLTGMERGLLKECSYKKHDIKGLEKKLAVSIKSASKVIVKLGGVEAVKEYRLGLGGVLPGYCLTHLKDYTNKKGITKPAHYNCWNNYAGSTYQLGTEPVMVLTYLYNSIENWEDGCFEVDRETGEVSPIKHQNEKVNRNKWKNVIKHE
jgi:hypothetical protein